LKEAPVAHVQNDCVGCGLCGELAQTATLCPSFFKIDVLSNPNWLDKAFHGMRRAVIGWLQGNQTAAQQS
jgi:indolepyruvate ferredoxin oxidoreductase alpha subunit